MSKVDAKAVNALQIRAREIEDPVVSKTTQELIQLTATLQTLGAAVAESPANDGRFVTATLAIGGTAVKHNLGRQALGAFPVYQSAPAAIAVTGLDATNITVNASAACTVKLWIF